MSPETSHTSVSSATHVADDAVGVPALNWYAAIVNPRHERKVAEKLTALGLETYVAAQEELHVWKNGRRRRVQHVIIPSIVFVRCTELKRRRIVAMPFIFRFVVNRAADTGTLRRPVAVIPDREMDKLKFMLGQTDCPVDFQPVTFRVNDHVRVIRGALTGLVGEITQEPGGHHTLTVAIAQLGCARVTIKPQDVEIIS